VTRLAVLVPTRSRPESIDRIVEAWWLTGAFDVADLWFVYDYDDMRRFDYERKLGSLPEVKAISMPIWRPLVPKLNQAAESMVVNWKYPFVAFMGDDHLPRTQRWAHMLVEDHATSRRPNVVYGQDGFFDKKLPTWWSMDARVIQALGNRMVPAPVQHLFCDNAVKELGEAADCLDYDERILIEHMHPIHGKGKMDAQYERVNRPQQYDRDGSAFREWQLTRLAEDATLVRSAGG
jgi:hypothetical protein